MTDQPGTPQSTQFNVIADFADQDGARKAILDLERGGVESGRISLLGAGDTSSRTRPTQGSDMYEKDYAAVSSVGKRVLTGAVAGVVIGLVIGAVIGVVTDGNIVLIALGAAIVGGVLGGLWGGYTNVPVSGEAFEETYDPRTAGPTQLVVRTDDEAEFDRAMKALESSGATNLSRIGRDGKRVGG